jgi:hypothetical protein
MNGRPRSRFGTTLRGMFFDDPKDVGRSHGYLEKVSQVVQLFPGNRGQAMSNFGRGTRLFGICHGGMLGPVACNSG